MPYNMGQIRLGSQGMDDRTYMGSDALNGVGAGQVIN